MLDLVICIILFHLYARVACILLTLFFREVNIELHVCRINSASDDWLRYEFIIVNLYAFLSSQYSG